MSTSRKRRPGRPSKYPPEFRRDAVAMVLDEHHQIADVARSLGINEGTLGNWVGKEREAREQGSALNVDERAELLGPRPSCFERRILSRRRQHQRLRCVRLRSRYCRLINITHGLSLQRRPQHGATMSGQATYTVDRTLSNA